MAASGVINQRQVDVYADGNWLYPAKDREVMVLHTLTVDPDLSGRGIGRAFAQFYEDCARQAGCTFMGTPVTPLYEAAKSLGLSPRAARERVARGGFGMGDALLLEGRNFARFKRENNLRVTAASLWIITRSGFDKLKALSAAPRLAEQT